MSDQKEFTYCIDVGPYEQHLTFEKAYKIIDTDPEKKMLRIRGDQNRLVWIPNYYFNYELNPEFELWLEFEEWDNYQDLDLSNDFSSAYIYSGWKSFWVIDMDI